MIGDAAKAANWKETGAPASDFLVAGSPGMQADRATDLGIDPKHMWAMGGGTDDLLVRYGGAHAGLGDNLAVPADPIFGGNVLQSDAGSHGAFWDKNSRSLQNQAAVAAGRYEVAVHD